MNKTFTLNQVDFFKDPSKAILFEEFLQTHSYHGDKITEVIYKSERGDFLGDSQIVMTNERNLFNKSCYTTAKFETGEILTSENVVKIIGQRNYDKVFTALCSIISQEFKVQSILALLTRNKGEDKCIQTDDFLPVINSSTNANKTEVISSNLKHQKLQNSHAVKVEVIASESLDNSADIDDVHESRLHEDTLSCSASLFNSMALADDIDLDVSSNMTDLSLKFSNVSAIELNQDSIMQDIDNNTDTGTVITVLNKAIRLPFTPKDQFHFASKENLLKMPKQDQKLLWMHQTVIDYKYCMESDTDQMLPIHRAVIANEIEVVGRHSVILRNKAGTVDILADGDSPLHLALKNGSKECIHILLSQDASVSLADTTERNALHLAVEAGDEEALNIIDEYCEKTPSYVIEELPQNYEKDLNLSPPELKALLMDNLCCQFNNQGCTPLMLACRAGNHKMAAVLIKMSEKSVSCRSPKSGETALFQTVTHACLEASKIAKDAKISKDFLNTVKVLLDGGALPDVPNFSGTTISQILSTDYNYPELTMLLLNRDFYKKFYETNNHEELNKMMLVKSKHNKIQLSEVKTNKTPKRNTTDIQNSPNTDKIGPQTQNIKVKSIDSMVTKEDNIAAVDIVPKKQQFYLTINGNRLKNIPQAQQIKNDGYVKIAPKPNASKNIDGITIDAIVNNAKRANAISTTNLISKMSLPIIVNKNILQPKSVFKRSPVPSNLTASSLNMKSVTIKKAIETKTTPKFVKILPNSTLSVGSRVGSNVTPAVISPLRMESKLVPFDKQKIREMRLKRSLDDASKETVAKQAKQ